MFDVIRDNLWTLIRPPLLWATHFLTCYITVAVSCARAADPLQRIDGARSVIAVATLVALWLIAADGRRAWGEWRARHRSVPHDRSSASEQERLLELATLLLAALSLVAVSFVALPALLFVDCR